MSKIFFAYYRKFCNYSLVMMFIFLSGSVFADSIVVSAKVKNIADQSIYAKASSNGEFLDVDPFVLEGDAWLMNQKIFEGGEEDHFVEIQTSPKVSDGIVVEQRTLTRAWLHDGGEGKTMPTGVYQVSKWKPMKELGAGQYQLRKLDTQYPKNTLRKIIKAKDDNLDDHWKSFARQCIREKSSDCEALDYVEEIEIRVMIKENKKLKEVEKIRISEPYGC